MDKDTDKILRRALSPDAEPPKALNAEILRKAEEKKTMSIKKRRMALTLAAAVIACSATAVAAIKYLSPSEVAKEATDKSLAEAFQSENAVYVNETQEYGGYKVTFLGMVSGKGLSDYAAQSGGEILDDRTYAVTAIEKADGTEMSYDDEVSFLATPVIKGLNPVRFNAFTLNGGYSEFYQDGILYRITECDNVEVFADRGAYLAVMDSMSYNIDAYNFDEATGELTRNENYDGLNALFELPLDESKSDAMAAQSIIDDINTFWDTDSETDDGKLSETDGDVQIVLTENENGEIEAKEVK